MFNPNLHHRRSIRLKGYDYSQAGMYFITICCQDRSCRFGAIENGEMILNDMGKLIEEEWQYLKIKYPHIELHEYVIMPNHFHAIVEIVGAGSARPKMETEKETKPPIPSEAGRANPAPTIGNIIGFFKYQTTKKINLPVKLWQRNYYEHIIRNEQSYQNISNYIINNPAKWTEDKFYTDRK
ncbi:MAG: hypothetical protein LBQ73_03910 [Tannerellaceae bacterium]|jgi:REP element-mobilizing transposase RayT|nr:hypothetical protein [Tannerellaceae bacterium]